MIKAKDSLSSKGMSLSTELLQNLDTTFKKTKRFIELKEEARKPAPDSSNQVILRRKQTYTFSNQL